MSIIFLLMSRRFDGGGSQNPAWSFTLEACRSVRPQLLVAPFAISLHTTLQSSITFKFEIPRRHQNFGLVEFPSLSLPDSYLTSFSCLVSLQHIAQLRKAELDEARAIAGRQSADMECLAATFAKQREQAEMEQLPTMVAILNERKARIRALRGPGNYEVKVFARGHRSSFLSSAAVTSRNGRFQGRERGHARDANGPTTNA